MGFGKGRRSRWALLGGVLLLLVALGGLLYALAALRQAREAEAAVRAAVQEVRGLSLSGLLQEDPAVLAALGARLRAAGDRAARARALLAPATALARLPGVPEGVQARARLLALSPALLRAAGRTAEALTEALASLRSGDRAEAEARLEAARPALAEARDALARLLGDPQARALVTEGNGSPAALQALWLVTSLGARAPSSVVDLLEALLLWDGIRQAGSDPVALLGEPGEMAARLRLLERRMAAVADALAALDPQEADRAGLSLAALRRQVAGAAQAAKGLRALAEVGLAALEDGPFSPAFGQKAGRPLEEAVRALGAAAEALEDPAVRDAWDFARFARWFLGYEGPRRYLLVGQNPQEIRATGGFIGLVAEVTLKDGVMGPLRVLDSTQVDPDPLATDPPAPPGLYWYLWMDRMLFRDSNWNPDFPSSARTIAALYRRAQGRDVDGVVAGTKELMVRLVGAVGGVEIPGYPGLVSEAVARDLVDERLPYACRPDHASRRPKRCAQEDLFRALLARLRTPQGLPLGPVLGVVREALATKHLLVQVFGQDVAPALWRWGWNGALARTDGDYLLVVESSLPGHAAPRVQRRLEYRVRLRTDGPSEARLRLRYRHLGPPREGVCRQAATTPEGCYWNYLRIYLSRWARDVKAPPVLLHEGSEKLAWGYQDADSLTVGVSQEPGTLGLVEVGAYLTVEPGTLLTFPLSFRLDPGALLPVAPGVWEYRLLLQKQPGVDDLAVEVEVELPEGAVLTDARPAPDAEDGGRLRFRLTLDRDREVAVRFR